MPSPRKERPLGVTILAVACICAGPLFVLAGLVWLIVSRNILLFFVPFGAIPLVLGILMGLLWGSFLLAIGIGLLRVKNWSRWSLIALVGYGLFDGIVALLDVRNIHWPNAALVLLAVSVGVCVLRYLSKPRVREAFGAIPS